MSVPYEIKELDTGVGGRVPKASEKIPIIAQPWVSDRAKKVLDIVWTALNPLIGQSSYTDCCI
jgi:acyl-CoA dehydrogenase